MVNEREEKQAHRQRGAGNRRPARSCLPRGGRSRVPTQRPRRRGGAASRPRGTRTGGRCSPRRPPRPCGGPQGRRLGGDTHRRALRSAFDRATAAIAGVTGSRRPQAPPPGTAGSPQHGEGRAVTREPPAVLTARPSLTPRSLSLPETAEGSKPGRGRARAGGLVAGPWLLQVAHGNTY